MIKEVVNKKIVNQIDSIVNLIGSYFGEEHYETILERGKNIEVALFRGKGKVEYGDTQMYLGEEPVCIKDGENSRIFLPVNLLGDKHGNVVLTHLLMHAVLTDDFKEKYEDFNEVLVDYIANDLSKYLRVYNINVTLEENPIYESNSFYSNFFNEIEDFYLDNKSAILDYLVNYVKLL